MTNKNKVRLTPEQLEAIHSSGKNILVSASAGSGKTFVMVNRIIEKIKAGAVIESLYVSTFTKKAAAELRVRLEKELKKVRSEIEEAQAIKNLTIALRGLQAADIGTTDAFAQRMLREHFNYLSVKSVYTEREIPLDPTFRVLADQSEAKILRDEVFERLVEAYLEEDENIPVAYQMSVTDFEKLAKNFSKDRNINGFRSVVDNSYDFYQKTENFERKLTETFLLAFDKYQSISDLYGNLAVDLKDDFEDYLNMLSDNISGFSKGTAAKIEVWLEQKANLLNYLSENKFTAFIESFESLQTNAGLNGNNFKGKFAVENGIKEKYLEVVGPATGNGKVINFISKMKHADLIEKYQPEALKVAKNLQKFVLYFYQDFLEQKMENSALEYSDIIHFAIDILENNQEIREKYQNKYSEIMIDEYQDTDHTQEALFKLLSKGNNIFMVGDIKQSIYGFRLADSQLFYNKYIDFQASKNPNQLIRLKENFRSRPEVLSFTNEIFKHLMNEEIGEMVYGLDEELVKGNKDYPDELADEFLPELLLYNSDGQKTENQAEQADEDLTVSKAEIEVVAREIKKLLDSDVKPSDIAILVRSKTNNNTIEDILKSHDIPLVLDEGRMDFLKSIEVMVMLDILRAIDNPLYDIPLVAMLRSPLFSFNEDELARIALQAGRDYKFYQKLELILAGRGAKTDLITNPLAKKIKEFISQLNRWRALVNQISIHQLLWQIYVDSYYLDYVGALENGEMRQANLHALSERAESFESAGYKGLYRFIKRIEKIMQTQNDLASVNIKIPQDAVRVMTFHKSKGLEFDYIFVMNLQTKFNQKDLAADVILSRENGLGMKYQADLKSEIVTDFPYALVKMDSFGFTANREQKELAGLSEEMRVLYVAFTRAKKKLFMVGKIKSKELEKYRDAKLEAGILINDFRRSSSKGFLNWILALYQATKLPMKLTEFTDADIEVGKKEFKSKPKFAELVAEAEQFDDKMATIDEVSQANQILNEIESYNRSASLLSSIQTPSQIKRRSYEKLLEDGGVLPQGEFLRKRHFALENFKEKKISATDIGSAVHAFMQSLDFNQADIFGLQANLEMMKLSDELKNKIEIDKIDSLFTTKLGQLLQEHADKIVKESPFSMLKLDEQSGGQYVVRGIVDGFVNLVDRIILFDYKTDHFKSKADIAEIRERYQLQMDLYAEALSQAYSGKKVEKYLILMGGPDQVIVEQL